MAGADALTFTATSSVQAYQALRTPGGQPMPVPALVVCIGPTTAANARALGLPEVHEAWGASAQGMVDALIHHLDGHAGTAS